MSKNDSDLPDWYDDELTSGKTQRMESLDYWRLCDELSVVQAALLIVGGDPSNSAEDVLDWEPYKRPFGFNAAFAAVSHAVLAGHLKGTIRRDERTQDIFDRPRPDESIGRNDVGVSVIYKKEPNWHRTTVAVDDLQAWLRRRGLKTGFFFPEKDDVADYLDPSNPNYSPKLAAAIGAWEAVSRDTSLTRGKTVKQAIAKWLRQNADRFGLTKEDGSPNEQGIEEVSKIANWDTKGGAPKTPGE